MDLFKGIAERLFGCFGLSSLISEEIHEGWTILDAGCGRSSPLSGLYVDSCRIGLDSYAPYIINGWKKNVHHFYVIGDVRALPFKIRTFDCTVATEVLEHLSRSDGQAMLQEIKRVTRRKIILTIPNGFLPTYAGPEDNPDEMHLSGYTTRDLCGLGFRVRGFHGFQHLWTIKNGQAIVRFRLPHFISAALVALTELLVYHRPYLAFQLFAVKDLYPQGQEGRS